MIKRIPPENSKTTTGKEYLQCLKNIIKQDNNQMDTFIIDSVKHMQIKHNQLGQKPDGYIYYR